MESNLCDDAKISTQGNSKTSLTPPKGTQVTCTTNIVNGTHPLSNTGNNVMGSYEPGCSSTENRNSVKSKLKEIASKDYGGESIIPKKYQYNDLLNEGVSEFSELSLYPKKPNYRAEMLWLLKVTDKMLSEAGIDEEHLEMAIGKKGSQMEKFIYLINQEKDVYNRVFREVIRQASVECRERGMLLAELRRRYASLLDRVPRQVVGLHQELQAQRDVVRHTVDTFQTFKQATGGLLGEMKTIIQQVQTIRLGALQLRNIPGNCQLYFSSEQTEIEEKILKLEEDTNAWETESNNIGLPENIEYLTSEKTLDPDDKSSISQLNDGNQKLDEQRVCMTRGENKHKQPEEEDSGYAALQLFLSRLKRAEERAAKAEEQVCELQLRLNLLDKTGY